MVRVVMASCSPLQRLCRLLFAIGKTDAIGDFRPVDPIRSRQQSCDRHILILAIPPGVAVNAWVVNDEHHGALPCNKRRISRHVGPWLVREVSQAPLSRPARAGRSFPPSPLVIRSKSFDHGHSSPKLQPNLPLIPPYGFKFRPIQIGVERGKPNLSVERRIEWNISERRQGHMPIAPVP
jgi:hypothetical protein